MYVISKDTAYQSVSVLEDKFSLYQKALVKSCIGPLHTHTCVQTCLHITPVCVYMCSFIHRITI